MTTTRVGVTAIAASAAEALPPEPEQLDLLPSRFEGEAREAQLAAVKRGRGRPPGARNLATRERIALCIRAFGDPMVQRMKWAMHTPDSLALELGCSKLEAFQELAKLWSDLCTYIHARQAATDADGNAVAPVFQMTIGGIELGADGARTPPWLYLQNQGLSGTDPAWSDGNGSDNEAK